MNTLDQDNAAAEVAAMQFAGGMSITRVAELWEKDSLWVEGAIRQALLASIPRRDGGTKVSRTDVRAERRAEALMDVGQAALFEETL
jgi:hypothetical protein